MKSQLFILLLLVAGAFAVTELPTPVDGKMVTAIRKIVDDIDRKTDVIQTGMTTTVYVNNKFQHLENITVKQSQFKELKTDFLSFKQDMNFKYTTLKIEILFLMIGAMLSLFIFQKFWELGQVLFNRWANRVENKTDERYKSEIARLKAEIKSAKKAHSEELRRAKQNAKDRWGFNPFAKEVKKNGKK